jgi:isoprenylcysteine carboxyl methyltransferase (ICMT) family protein YpbQ
MSVKRLYSARISRRKNRYYDVEGVYAFGIEKYLYIVALQLQTHL